ncbi:cupredoxin domain-containing protein [Hyalangium minutum]|uniref:Lead, cadmium, zinc and mercury transporting ATPase n=1 Tax=Hyalangium minutum TaxID=394096 RepID=A0A085WUJ0_9BACT|nr:cupredoxin domain-containing protein [Hyalangium minutum]KFE71353.1 Lead, cadmium, zinc and mercury transporting ATPase [Hyalangium minutum]
MKHWMGWLLIAGLVAACDKKTEAPGAGAPPPTTASASAKQAHENEPHEHASPHGGLVESSSRGHVELVASRDGKYRVYLLDDDMKVRPVEGASGSIKVAKAGYPNVVLAPEGDHLVGEGPAHTDEHLAMVVTVVQGGKPETLRFNAHLEAKGHAAAGAEGMKAHDHTPLQGGMVAMSGELHLEVLSQRSGEVRVWVTDAFRKPVPLEGMKGTVNAGGQSVPLTPEPGGQFLTAKLSPSDQERETTVRLPMPGDPEYFITFLLTPKDARAAAASAPIKSEGRAAPEAMQEVTINVAGGYQPSEVSLKKGVPVRLRFIRKDTGGCSEELVIPDFGVKKALPGLTETVVEFTPDKTGTFPFTCGMGMLKGQLVVN